MTESGKAKDPDNRSGQVKYFEHDIGTFIGREPNRANGSLKSFMLRPNSGDVIDVLVVEKPTEPVTYALSPLTPNYTEDIDYKVKE